MRLTSALLAALALALPPAARAAPDSVAVEVTNESEPVLCAEKDNVSLKFVSPQVKRFRIEAAHPAYMAGLLRDNWEADWTACDMSGDPVHVAPVPPRRITFYESIEYWLVGYTFPSFWRPATATVRVGDRVEKGLHLVQLWRLGPQKSDEILVVYPQDGYWRARPLPPSQFKQTTYGSSFLFGPVETDAGRPVVNIKEIVFDPKTLTFTLEFKDGNKGSLRLSGIDENRMALDAALERPVDGGRAFAQMRSMYVTEFNNDVARIAVREPAAKGWREEPIMAFGKALASDVWAGRTTHSQHNTSSPDMMFRNFSTASGLLPLPEKAKP